MAYDIYHESEYQARKKRELPNPKSILDMGHDSVPYVTFMLSDKYPEFVANNYVLDIYNNVDVGKIKARYTFRFINEKILDDFLSNDDNNIIPVQKLDYIFDTGDLINYVMFATGIIICIQVSAYRYFQNRYPGSKFYCSAQRYTVMSVRDGKKLVGMCMPIILSDGNLARIHERIESHD